MSNIVSIKDFDYSLVSVEFIEQDKSFMFRNISAITLVSGKYVHMQSIEANFWMPANLQFTITKEIGAE